MPEALATTKRKFHKLLDTRFGPAQVPATALAPAPSSPGTSPSQATTAEPSSKRIRSGASTASLATTLHRRNVSTTSTASANTIAKTPAPPTRDAPAPPTRDAPPPPTRTAPNFAPWSHDAFITRLHTYSPVTMWHPKPDAVNEVEWAKRGWSCVDTNTVACRGGCGNRLVVNVDPIVRRRLTNQSDSASHDQEAEEDGEDDQEEMEQALVDRYKHLVLEGHAEGCLWRQAACKNDIYRLPVVKSAVWQPELRSRYASLMNMPKSFQHLALKPDDTETASEKLLLNLPPTLLAVMPTAQQTENDPGSVELPGEHAEIKAKALRIAMCGWRGITDSSNDLLCCDACFQRIGLWMYQPDYKRPGVSADDDDEESEQDRSLDLIDSHRDHCPWRNAASQCATGHYAGLPAWQILQRIVAQYADEHRRRSKIGDVAAAIAASTAEGNIVESEEQLSVLEHMPELTREETNRLDKERASKLRRLKTVLGFKRKVPLSQP
ncbi:hypothetical protein MBLNU459_g8502t1 [Dothideomycetes sp. NU459]